MDSTPIPPETTRPLALREVLAAWAPLAGSWMLMGLELPIVTAVMARLPNATEALAAYGGVVFPVSLIVEAPILMLLTASTALARDRQSFGVVRRFMFTAAGLLTLVHAAIAFTPLFDFVAGTLIAVPEAAREPARLGLRLLLPWTFSIAYRRTHQGLLIRFGRAHAVTLGTMVRLGTLVTVLALGARSGRLPAIAVGAGAVACAVVAEAVAAHLSARPLLRGELASAPPAATPLTMPRFLSFYTPLLLTPLLNFLAMPISAAALSRMPDALASLATWPVLSGSTFTLRSVGFAYNEVVVAQLDRYQPLPALRRFATLLATIVTVLLALGAVSPLGLWWFTHGSALGGDMPRTAWHALALLVPTGVVSVWQSYHQGVLVHAHRTRAITESMFALLAGTWAVLATGVTTQRLPGLYFAAAALTVGGSAQIAWLAWRSRSSRAALVTRDAA